MQVEKHRWLIDFCTLDFVINRRKMIQVAVIVAVLLSIVNADVYQPLIWLDDVHVQQDRVFWLLKPRKDLTIVTPLCAEILRESFLFTGVSPRRRSVFSEGKKGVSFRLTVNVLDTTTCALLENVVVDLWHCDAEGIYSHFVASSLGQFISIDQISFFFFDFHSDGFRRRRSESDWFRMGSFGFLSVRRAILLLLPSAEELFQSCDSYRAEFVSFDQTSLVNEFAFVDVEKRAIRRNFLHLWNHRNQLINNRRRTLFFLRVEWRWKSLCECHRQKFSVNICPDEFRRSAISTRSTSMNLCKSSPSAMFDVSRRNFLLFFFFFFALVGLLFVNVRFSSLDFVFLIDIWNIIAWHRR